MDKNSRYIRKGGGGGKPVTKTSILPVYFYFNWRVSFDCAVPVDHLTSAQLAVDLRDDLAVFTELGPVLLDQHPVEVA